MPFIGGSNASTKPWTERGEYDASRYLYNGQQGGAAIERSNLKNRQQQVEERAAPQMQGTQLNQGAANQARGFQMGSLADLSAAASGKVPSAAENLAQRGIDRSLRAQVSAGGNVRGGPGAQAAAYRSAAMTGASTRADMNQGIQAERANEMATARGQLANAATATRGQDLTAATTNAQLTQDAAKTNLGAELQNRGLGDARAQQYEALQQGVSKDQLQAGLTQQQIAAQYGSHGDTLNTQTNQKNADRDWDLFTGVIGMGQGIAGGVAKALSDPMSKMPISGSLASLGLGGMPSGTTDIGGKGFASSEDIKNAAKGSDAGFGMVGGGGLTGGGNVPGGFPSDEDTKEAPRTWGNDEAETVSQKWLGRASKGAPVDGETPKGGAITTGKPKAERNWLDDMGESVANAKPYDRDPEVSRGAAGAPRGYSNGRAAPEADDVSWSKPDTWGSKKPAPAEKNYDGMAPGSEDWDRYGVEKGPVPEGAPGVFESIFGGLAGARPFAPPQRDMTTSDPDAKRAAYHQGQADARQSAAGGTPEPPKFAKPLSETEELVQKKDGDPEVRRKYTPMRSPSANRGDRGFAGVVTNDTRDPELDAQSELLETFARGKGISLKEASDLLANTNNEAKRASRFARQGPETASFAGARTSSTGAPERVALSDERTKDEFPRPSTEDMADAMRSMDPAVYAYKPNNTPADQAPGEVNVGPMANKMANDPVARTAIVRDDDTGMLAIDRGKAERVMMGSLASLQQQIDALKGDVPRGDAKKRRRAPDSAVA